MTEVRWLDEDEQKVWRLCLAASQRLAARVANDLASDDPPFSMGEYELLVRLSESPGGRARMAVLADELVHSRSRLTHTTARLEGRGLVARESCESDGRGVLAVLTPAGRRALEAAAPRHVESVRGHLFDALSPAQTAALGEIMDTLVAHQEGAGPAARSQGPGASAAGPGRDAPAPTG